MTDSLNYISDVRGDLIPIEFNDLPFEPKRIFYVTNVPEGVVRGNHAHYNTQQYLICLYGAIKVGLHDGKDMIYKTLHPGKGIFVDRGVWDNQEFLTGNDILLVLCSTHYDRNDYIFDFDVFLSLNS